MNGSITFAMIKPDAVADGHIGNIIAMIEQDGFQIDGLGLVALKKEDVAEFYEVHKDRPFYDDLCKYMSSGPVVALVLYKEEKDAVESFRKLIGATDPSKAEAGTIRAKYGKSVQSNAVHGSDSDENAEKEAKFFFD